MQGHPTFFCEPSYHSLQIASICLSSTAFLSLFVWLNTSLYNDYRYFYLRVKSTPNYISWPKIPLCRSWWFLLRSILHHQQLQAYSGWNVNVWVGSTGVYKADQWALCCGVQLLFEWPNTHQHSTQLDKYKNTGIGQWIPKSTFKTIKSFAFS